MLENGTPHYSEICAGFTAHGMTCPAIVNGLVVKGVDLNAEGLSAGPFAPASTTYTLYNLGPQQSLAFSVAIPAASRWLTTNKTSGTIALGQSTTVTLTIDQAQAKLLADGRYTAAVQFMNATSGVGTVTRDEKLRVGAPVPMYTANFNDGLQGFTVDGQAENLWHRSTACADSLTGHSSPGSLYYGKDSVCTYTTPIPLFHAINSPEITIANPQTAELGLKYFLKTENSSTADSASVLISVNGGSVPGPGQQQHRRRQAERGQTPGRTSASTSRSSCPRPAQPRSGSSSRSTLATSTTTPSPASPSTT